MGKKKLGGGAGRWLESWLPSDDIHIGDGKDLPPPKRCYESHPILKIEVDGKTFRVWGGSCSDPMVLDADIYVGLDKWSMNFRHLVYPWRKEKGKHVEEILFPITDMSTPTNPAEFKMMIEWLVVQIVSGAKVHIGCIGGHGRTGMVLAAIVKELAGIEDSITYVRKGYCEKAVETAGQVDFLHKHFGIKKVKGHKEGMIFKGADAPWPAHTQLGSSGGGKVTSIGSFVTAKKVVSPVQSSKCIYGD